MMWLFSKAKFSYYFQKSRPYFAYSVFRPGNTERIYPHNNNGDVVDIDDLGYRVNIGSQARLIAWLQYIFGLESSNQSAEAGYVYTIP